jgi:glutathione S-transferase
MWMDWNLSMLQPAIMGLFWGYYRTPEPQRNATRNQELLEQCHARLGQLDALLATRPYISGNQFTMADIPSGALLYRYFGMGLRNPDMPNLMAWYDRLCARKAYRQQIMQPFDDLFGRLAF